MLFNIYVIYDKVAEEAGPPFVAVNDGVALRKYRDMQIPASLKDDYEMRCLGLYDSVGVLVTPEIVYTVIDKGVIPNE